MVSMLLFCKLTAETVNHDSARSPCLQWTCRQQLGTKRKVESVPPWGIWRFSHVCPRSNLTSDPDRRAVRSTDRQRDCETDSAKKLLSSKQTACCLLSFCRPSSSIFLSVSLSFTLWMMHRPLDRQSTHWKSAMTFADKLKAGARRYFTWLRARGSEPFSLTIMEIAAAAGTWSWL